jgi:hypothetical protein
MTRDPPHERGIKAGFRGGTFEADFYWPRCIAFALAPYSDENSLKRAHRLEIMAYTERESG